MSKVAFFLKNDPSQVILTNEKLTSGLASHSFNKETV